MLKSIYSVLIIAFLSFGNFTLSNAAPSKPVACGSSDPCQDGFYCTGAVGESKSGVCVANSINVVMCRAVDYIQSDILKYFFLFGAMFAGVYFFLGKFTMVTFIQIVLGIGILFGAQKTIITLTGSSNGLCGQESAQACLGETTGIKVYPKEKKVRNLSRIAISPNFIPKGRASNQCDSLECVKAMCSAYTTTTTTSGSGTSAVTTTTCALTNKTVAAQVPDINANGQGFEVNNCQLGFKVTCTFTASLAFERDYFKCISCTGEAFAAEAPTAWNINNCKELVEKNIALKP